MNAEFKQAAAGFPEPFRLLVRETVQSTNDDLRELAQSGASSGLVLLALNQLAGRGRREAPWFSSPGDSLAFSILVRPDEPRALWPRFALATGLAVATAIETVGPATGIKWPNDVWIGRKKVAGILVEAGADFVVVGIGLNVNTDRFPSELGEIATSIQRETGTTLDRSDVLAAIIRRFALYHRQIGQEFNELADPIRQRCVLTGHRVRLNTAHGPREGVIDGIAPGGELLLRTANGIECLLQADEVRILD